MVLLPLLAGSLVYCMLVLVAARGYLRRKASKPAVLPGISMLRPLAGADEGLEANLCSGFEQRYPEFEILFAVRHESDPAVAIVRRLQAKYPNVPSRLIVTGEPPYPNAKVFSLDSMLAAARYDLLAMVDSDVRITPEMLHTIACELSAPEVGLVTCPYRAVPGPSFWSRIEAIGMNTEFLGGVLVARLVEGMKFALGPTIAARREVIWRIGGFDKLKDYLAEDFVMGQLAAAAGWQVRLSSYVIEHHIGSHPFRANLRHRLRWARSTRRSRPAGYVGQIFTNPLPLALMVWALQPHWWALLAVTFALRYVAAWATATAVLRDPLTRSRWWLVPVQDIASFAVWIAGFFGNSIMWRGRKYRLLPDGAFKLVE